MTIIHELQSFFFSLTRFRSHFLKSPSVEEIIKSPKVIVLTRLENVGDMLVFVPTLRNLRRHYPDSKIYLITKSNLGKNTISGCPYIDELMHLEDSLSGRWHLIKRLRKLKPDLFFISTQDCGRIKWAFWGGAKIIIGYQKTWEYDHWRKVKLAGFIQYAPVFDLKKSEIQRNLELLRIIGLKHLDSQMEYSWIKPENMEYVDTLFSELGFAQEDFVVAISPGTKRKPKAWFADRFAQVADHLIKHYQAKIVIIGTEKERMEVAEISRLMIYDSHLLLGATSLAQVPALLKRVNLLITVDSGPMHFAAAVATPFIALFGPGEFAKWSHTEDHRRQKNIYKKLECAPCEKKACGDLQCMKSISVEDVLDQLGQLEADGVILPSGKEAKKVISKPIQARESIYI